MQYPKKIMRKTELMKLGFPEEFLMFAYRFPGQNFASKVNPTKNNSPIFFETEGFEKWRMKQIQTENSAIACQRR